MRGLLALGLISLAVRASMSPTGTPFTPPSDSPATLPQMFVVSRELKAALELLDNLLLVGVCYFAWRRQPNFQLLGAINVAASVIWFVLLGLQFLPLPGQARARVCALGAFHPLYAVTQEVLFIRRLSIFHQVERGWKLHVLNLALYTLPPTYFLIELLVVIDGRHIFVDLSKGPFCRAEDYLIPLVGLIRVVLYAWFSVMAGVTVFLGWTTYVGRVRFKAQLQSEHQVTVVGQQASAADHLLLLLTLSLSLTLLTNLLILVHPFSTSQADFGLADIIPNFVDTFISLVLSVIVLHRLCVANPQKARKLGVKQEQRHQAARERSRQVSHFQHRGGVDSKVDYSQPSSFLEVDLTSSRSQLSSQTHKRV